MILTSTAAKAAVNLASRSRIRNRKECPAEVRVAWVAHGWLTPMGATVGNR